MDETSSLKCQSAADNILNEKTDNRIGNRVSLPRVGDGDEQGRFPTCYWRQLLDQLIKFEVDTFKENRLLSKFK